MTNSFVAGTPHPESSGALPPQLEVDKALSQRQQPDPPTLCHRAPSPQTVPHALVIELCHLGQVLPILNMNESTIEELNSVIVTAQIVQITSTMMWCHHTLFLGMNSSEEHV